MGARLGPNASGSITHYANSVTKIYPATRNASVGEVLNFLRAQDQIGFLPTLRNGAPLGFSRMASQDAYFEIALREAGSFAPIRDVGTTFRAHTALHQDTAQRAKAGYYPCCTQATHVAMGPLSALGDIGRL